MASSSNFPADLLKCRSKGGHMAFGKLKRKLGFGLIVLMVIIESVYQWFSQPQYNDLMARVPVFILACCLVNELALIMITFDYCGKWVRKQIKRNQTLRMFRVSTINARFVSAHQWYLKSIRVGSHLAHIYMVSADQTRTGQELLYESSHRDFPALKDLRELDRLEFDVSEELILGGCESTLFLKIKGVQPFSPR